MFSVSGTQRVLTEPAFVVLYSFVDIMQRLHNGQTTKQFEPRHEISNYVVRATSKAYDQPAHTRSLIRAFASRLNIL